MTSTTHLDLPDLLDARSMARFVADGFLRFDALVPAELCARIVDDHERGVLANVWPDYAGVPDDRRPGRPLAGALAGTSPGEVLALPAVAGIVESLLGPDPLYDHHYFHVTTPGSGGQPLHYDAIVDVRLDFDVQLFLFLQDTTPEMGGTLLVPGTHLRPAPDLSRVHAVVGQQRVVCPAGTLLACHHGLWHGGRPNRSDVARHLWKLRLNPTVSQTRRFAMATLDEPGVRDDVRRILTTRHGWEGGDLRHEIVRRTRLWRLVSGEPDYDTESWLRRLDCAPTGQRL